MRKLKYPGYPARGNLARNAVTGIEQRLLDAYHIGILQQKEIIKTGSKAIAFRIAVLP